MFSLPHLPPDGERLTEQSGKGSETACGQICWKQMLHQVTVSLASLTSRAPDWHQNGQQTRAKTEQKQEDSLRWTPAWHLPWQSPTHWRRSSPVWLNMCKTVCNHGEVGYRLKTRDANIISTSSISADTGFKIKYRISASTLISTDIITDKIISCCFLD